MFISAERDAGADKPTIVFHFFGFFFSVFISAERDAGADKPTLPPSPEKSPLFYFGGVISLPVF